MDKVRRCVGSVRGQSKVSYEHLFQDACSTDGTADWLRSQPDLNVVVERDTGMYDAINRGWVRSRGEVISWLNGDEQYLPRTLATVEGEFRKHGDIDFVYGNAIIVDAKGTPIAARRDIRLSRFYIRNASLSSYSCTMFFRRRLLDEGILNLDSKYRFAADMDLVLRLLEAGKRPMHIPEYLSLFTVDGTNLSRDPRMLEESERLRRAHGALSFKPARNLARAGRLLERLFLGRLNPASIEYEFAEDEAPQYRRIRQQRVPASYKL
jgi:glycosyltransferase involved in cell wall biosynthesis